MADCGDSEGNFKPMTFSKIVGLFVIMGLGVSFTTVIFCGEIAIGFKKRQKWNVQP